MPVSDLAPVDDTDFLNGAAYFREDNMLVGRLDNPFRLYTVGDLKKYDNDSGRYKRNNQQLADKNN